MTDEHQDENRVLIDNPDRPSRTYLEDWVLMCGASMRAKLYYWALRSWIFEKDPEYVVTITDPEMAEFMGCSVRTAERSRNDAAEAGLIRVHRETKPRTYVNGRPQDRPMVRWIEVVLDPPEGYEGAVNSVLERKRIRAKHGDDGPSSKKRKKADKDSSDASEEGPHICGPDDDQGKPDSEPRSSRGGSADLSEPTTILSEPTTDVSDRATKLPELTAPDQGEPAPQDETGQDETGQDEADEHLDPFGNTQKGPDPQKVYVETPGKSADGETKQGEYVGNSLHAYARAKAGPAAIEEIEVNPQVSEPELAKVILRAQPDLSWSQALGRAATLLAHERKDADSSRLGASQSA